MVLNVYTLTERKEKIQMIIKTMCYNTIYSSVTKYTHKLPDLMQSHKLPV